MFEVAEVVLHIYSFVAESDGETQRSNVRFLVPSFRVCRDFNRTLSADAFWKPLFLRDFQYVTDANEFLKLTKVIPKKKKKKQELESISTDDELSWKEKYKQRLLNSWVIRCNVTHDVPSTFTMNFFRNLFQGKSKVELQAYNGLPPKLPSSVSARDEKVGCLVFDFIAYPNLIKEEIAKLLSEFGTLMLDNDGSLVSHSIEWLPDDHVIVNYRVLLKEEEITTLNDPILHLVTAPRNTFDPNNFFSGAMTYPLYHLVRRLRFRSNLCAEDNVFRKRYEKRFTFFTSSIFRQFHNQCVAMFGIAMKSFGEESEKVCSRMERCFVGLSRVMLFGFTGSSVVVNFDPEFSILRVLRITPLSRNQAKQVVLEDGHSLSELEELLDKVSGDTSSSTDEDIQLVSELRSKHLAKFTSKHT